jgi:GntR family transcriptional regulator
VLGIRRGKPLLYIEEIDYDRDGTPVMLSREWHVSEAFDVRVNRKAHTRGEYKYAIPAHTSHAVAGRPITSSPSTTA